MDRGVVSTLGDYGVAVGMAVCRSFRKAMVNRVVQFMATIEELGIFDGSGSIRRKYDSLAESFYIYFVLPWWAILAEGEPHANWAKFAAKAKNVKFIPHPDSSPLLQNQTVLFCLNHTTLADLYVHDVLLEHRANVVGRPEFGWKFPLAWLFTRGSNSIWFMPRSRVSDEKYRYHSHRAEGYLTCLKNDYLSQKPCGFDSSYMDQHVALFEANYARTMDTVKNGAAPNCADKNNNYNKINLDSRTINNTPKRPPHQITPPDFPRLGQQYYCKIRSEKAYDAAKTRMSVQDIDRAPWTAFLDQNIALHSPHPMGQGPHNAGQNPHNAGQNPHNTGQNPHNAVQNPHNAGQGVSGLEKDAGLGPKSGYTANQAKIASISLMNGAQYGESYFAKTLKHYPLSEEHNARKVPYTTPVYKGGIRIDGNRIERDSSLNNIKNFLLGSHKKRTSIAAYPEGRPSHAIKPLRTGMLKYAYCRGIATQVVFTNGVGSAGSKQVTIKYIICEPVFPADHSSFESFYKAVDREFLRAHYALVKLECSIILEGESKPQGGAVLVKKAASEAGAALETGAALVNGAPLDKTQVVLGNGKIETDEFKAERNKPELRTGEHKTEYNLSSGISITEVGHAFAENQKPKILSQL